MLGHTVHVWSSCLPHHSPRPEPHLWYPYCGTIQIVGPRIAGSLLQPLYTGPSQPSHASYAFHTLAHKGFGLTHRYVLSWMPSLSGHSQGLSHLARPHQGPVESLLTSCSHLTPTDLSCARLAVHRFPFCSSLLLGNSSL